MQTRFKISVTIQPRAFKTTNALRHKWPLPAPCSEGLNASMFGFVFSISCMLITMVLIPRPPDPIDDTDKAKNIIFIPCETSTFHCKFYSLPCSCVILIISVSLRYGFLSFASACYMWNISCPLETSLWLFPGQSVRHGWYRLTALEDRSDDRSKNILLRQTRVNTASRWAMSWRRSQNEISGSAKFLKEKENVKPGHQQGRIHMCWNNIRGPTKLSGTSLDNFMGREICREHFKSNQIKWLYWPQKTNVFLI